MDAIALTLLLVIRTYEASALPSSASATARGVATDLLGATGTSIVWLDCGARMAEAAPGCREPIGASEVMVRFVKSSQAVIRPGDHALGFAYVDLASATGSLATIYTDRIAFLARETATDLGTLVGRVVAHEVGHLLLGTNQHRAHGLMRAEWSAESLQRRSAHDWRFSPADVEQIAKNWELRIER